MKYLQQVLKTLKPKVKRYGFSREDVESFAAVIAKKLDIEEDASDEDVASAIEDAIEDAIPYIEAAQKQSSRIVRRKLKEAREADEDEEDEDEDEDEEDEDDEPKGKKSKKSKKSKKGGKNSKKSDEDEDEDENDDDKRDDYISKQFRKLTKLVTAQNEEIAKLKQGKTSDRRRKRLEKILENTGTFGKSVLRRFDKQEFEDEDDFEDFLDEVREDLEELNTERKNNGLGKLGTPPSTRSSRKEDENSQEEAYSDEEIDDLADM